MKITEKITFVVPAYNVADTIQRTIDSILNQTDDRYFIVIVNDGSTDNTDEICLTYSKKYPDKITYISQENRGLGGARNRGMDMVKTEYVSFLDSDDWLMPEYVERINQQLEDKKNQRAEIIMVLPQIYHEGSKVISAWYDEALFQEVFPEDGYIINPQTDRRIYQFEVSQSRKLLKMEFVRKIDFRFREKIKWEDVYPHFYLLSQCEYCMGIRSVGFYYRIGTKGQITASHGKDRLDILAVFDELLDFVKGKDALIFPVMRVMVRFSIWSIRMANMEIKQLLVKEIHKVFIRIPRKYVHILRKESKKGFTKADARQYGLFLTAIRHRIFIPIFYDYLYQNLAEKLIKKLLKVKKRVA
ncbi:MAG: glycosyltransferase family 2 protein [Lachnospiraceae bacterium]|nr:glycosyltransferase family 2 protein [Lachnospiraceae bacterium]MDE7201243.1 glycosyltransferase family 2 protein [Lachnospiraceae bacterium]